MVKVKVVNYNKNEKTKNNSFEEGFHSLMNNVYVSFLIKIIINSLVLLFASAIFQGFYIKDFLYAFLGALIINILDYSIKPILVYLMLPITIMSMGILYPIVNVIVLKLTSAIIGYNFTVDGIIVPFFIAIFISIMNITFESLVIKKRKMIKWIQ